MHITDVSVYKVSVFVQGKDPLTVFFDHLGRQDFIFLILHKAFYFIFLTYL